MHTPEFRRHFVEFVPVDALRALKLATKGWNPAADALIDEVVRSGELMVHGGEGIIYAVAEARIERRARTSTQIKTENSMNCEVVMKIIEFLKQI
ncbi:hypothetical protein TrLO_g13959 [Triparma laevis f. longispina]|nr:hypothetical protein TrLO_g13959 [Triparma laevis f. longispina]